VGPIGQLLQQLIVVTNYYELIRDNWCKAEETPRYLLSEDCADKLPADRTERALIKYIEQEYIIIVV